MKNYSSVIVFILILWSTIANAETKRQDIPKIKATTAYNEFKNGKAIIIDSMPSIDYEKEHMLGSINIQNDGRADLDKLRSMQLPFDKNQVIYVYCG